MTEHLGVPGPRSRGRALWALLLGAALVILFAGFVALGLWQLQRLGWKQDLIARIEQRLAAAPAAPPAAAAWPALNKADDEYKRLRLQGHFDHARETLVSASTALGTGYWVLTPLRVDPEDGKLAFWLLVNRGFVPLELRDPTKRGAPPDTSAAVSLEGLLRLSEPGGSLLQKNDVSAGRWYSRDVAAIAAARGLQGPVAPYFVDAWPEPAPSAGETWPHPGLTVLKFSNNHRSYALTWFAMAIMVAGIAFYLLRERQRAPSDADLEPRPFRSSDDDGPAG